ncbi:MAG: hypothetical protein GY940_10885, partial [bacterium]|nr:hypothetical protein [bacterium]
MKLTIRKRILIITLIPTVAFLAYSMLNIRNEVRALNEADHIGALPQLLIVFNELVHETQKERGRTAGFLGSGGKKWQEELKAQREKTDGKKRSLLKFLSDFDTNSYGTAFNTLLEECLTRLKQLESMREKISQLEIDTNTGIAYFSGLNTAILKTFSYIPALINNGEVSKQFLALSNLLFAKEKAGIERALLTSVFSRNRFKNKMEFSSFNSLVDLQKLFISNFLSIADGDKIRLYREKVKDISFAEVERMREAANNWAPKGELIAGLE